MRFSCTHFIFCFLVSYVFIVSLPCVSVCYCSLVISYQFFCCSLYVMCLSSGFVCVCVCMCLWLSLPLCKKIHIYSNTFSYAGILSPFPFTNFTSFLFVFFPLQIISIYSVNSFLSFNRCWLLILKIMFLPSLTIM